MLIQKKKHDPHDKWVRQVRFRLGWFESNLGQNISLIINELDLNQHQVSPNSSHHPKLTPLNSQTSCHLKSNLDKPSSNQTILDPQY